MKLLTGFIRWLMVLAYRITISLARVLFRLLWPYVVQLLGLLRELIFFSLTAAVQGPATYSARAASNWTRQLLNLGADRSQMDEIYVFCRWLAELLIVLGWILTIFFTVEIVRLAFWFFTR